ncbi:MAG: nucleotide exchange factor GrpE [Candidatus Firestonebacteria bacterium]
MKEEEAEEVEKVKEVEDVGKVEEVNKEEKEEKEVKEEIKEIDELSKLQNELSEYKDKYLRSLAEMDNLKKIINKGREDFLKYATSSLVLNILPVLDNFEIALKIDNSKLDKNFIRGIKLIYNNLKEVLEKEGLKKQQTHGLYFNPNEHEVVNIVETDKDKEDGMIIEELRSGYNFKDMVIRPAMVKIAKKKEVKEVEEVEEVKEGKEEKK